MALLYAVSAWLLMQIADVVIGLAGLPEWIGSNIIILLAVGFPIALVLSWFYEKTPKGVLLQADLDQSTNDPHVRSRRIDFIVISILSAALLLFAYDKWWVRGLPDTSIAVLPFVNMSTDANNEYFSEGLSEELINILVQVPELRVTGRTSAFSFRESDASILEIGRQLDVSHILEGSVRASGQNIRVTAQLIDARTDTQVWSQSFDRTLSDIFAIQDEIAKAVVSQLRVRLLPGLFQPRDVDPEAYSYLLQAAHAANIGTADDYANAISLYRKAIESDPTYAAPWDGLANVYLNQASFGIRPSGEAVSEARQALGNALEIDPDFASALGRRGWISMMIDGDLAEAARDYERALVLAPEAPNLLSDTAVLATLLGRLDVAIRLNERVVQRDPLAPATFNLALTYLWAGRYDDARTYFRKRLQLRPNHVLAHYYIGISHLLEGDADAAIQEIVQEPIEIWKQVGLAMSYFAAGKIAEADDMLATLKRKPERLVSYNLAHVMAFRGDVDKAFAWLDKAYMVGDPNLTEVLGEPLFANLRADPRWLTFLRKIGRDPEKLSEIQLSIDHLIVE